MAKQTKTPKSRTQVKDLPKTEKTLTKEEQKQVKGGSAAHAGYDVKAMKKV